eukprot:403374081
MASRSSNRRLKNVTKYVPIAVGSISLWQGKKAHEEHTHKWACYVRGLNEEDISYFIKKVQFSLHPSFPEPVRTIEKFPFEICLTGWGEFDIGIKIFFTDPAEKPVEMGHLLKLYPGNNQQQSTKKPVISEKYDEIVFFEPTEHFAYILDKGPKQNEQDSANQSAGAQGPQVDQVMLDDASQPINPLEENKNANPEELKQQQTATSSSTKEKQDDKNKPLDRRQFLQFYGPFPSDDKDIDTIQEALDFIRSQVQQAREELVEYEKKVSVNRKQARDLDLDSYQQA